MQVLHISTAMTWRGGEQQLAYLLEGLKKKELKQVVYCFKNSAIEKYCQENSIETITHGKLSPFHPFLITHFSLSCKQKNIQLIHAHDAHAHTLAVLSGFLAGNAAQILLSRKVDFPIKNNFFSRFKYNYKGLKKIICVSNKINEILSKAILNKKVLTTIYDGIDLLRFKHISSGILRREYTISSDELIIGNVAAIAAHKDYFTFVDTAEKVLLSNRKVKFLIIGDGPERKGIEEYIAKKNLQKQVLIVGFRSDIPQILPEFDLLLFTSKTEGLGSSILDAYACKVPVVATNAGGIPEIVQSGSTGLLAEVKNATELSEKVIQLISDSELRSRLTENAFAFVQNFTKEKMVERTYSCYQDLISAQS